MKWQKLVAEFVAKKNVNVDLQTRMLDLVAELGELSKEALKGTHYGRKAWRSTPNWSPELGEVFFSLICIANMTGVDLDLCLAQTMANYDAAAPSAARSAAGANGG